MVDLHGVGRLGAADELDGLPAVGVDERATLRVAGAAAHHEVLQIAPQDVIAGVAAVVSELDVDIVAPGLAELVALEIGGAVPAADLQAAELLAGTVESGRIPSRGRRRDRRRWRRFSAPGR